MNNPLRQTRSDIRQSRSYLANSKVFGSIWQWLAGFIQLTEKEKMEAGIYLGNQTQ